MIGSCVTYYQFIKLLAVVISCQVSRWTLIGWEVFVEQGCDPIRLMGQAWVSLVQCGRASLVSAYHGQSHKD